MRRIASLAASLLLAACASLPAPEPVDLSGLPAAFDVSGRVSVAQSGQGEVFRLRWSRGPGRDSWTVSTPVGTEAARIERGPEGLTVLRPGEGAILFRDFEDLSERLFGAPVDDRSLAAWVHGRAVAGPGSWSVTVDERQWVGAREVARRVTARRGDVVLKLVVDDYREGRE